MVSGRGPVKPLRPFDVRRGKLGPGAWELAARRAALDVGQQVFRDGLADPSLWTRRIGVLDVGVNWYLTRYIKIDMGWMHDEFSTPIVLDANHRHMTRNMLWIRFQIDS